MRCSEVACMNAFGVDHSRPVNNARGRSEYDHRNRPKLCGLIRHDDNDQLSFPSLAPSLSAPLSLHATLIGASERDHRKRPVPSPCRSALPPRRSQSRPVWFLSATSIHKLFPTNERLFKPTPNFHGRPLVKLNDFMSPVNAMPSYHNPASKSAQQNARCTRHALF